MAPISNDDRFANLYKALSFENHKGALSQPELFWNWLQATSSMGTPSPFLSAKSHDCQASAWHRWTSNHNGRSTNVAKLCRRTGSPTTRASNGLSGDECQLVYWHQPPPTMQIWKTGPLQQGENILIAGFWQKKMTSNRRTTACIWVGTRPSKLWPKSHNYSLPWCCSICLLVVPQAPSNSASPLRFSATWSLQ